MSGIVDDKFREWTTDLDPRSRRISIFRHIRDIPYSLTVPMTDPKIAPEKILALGRGSCGPKHYLLAAMYRKLGYEVAYATFAFLWNDPEILYPPELRQLAICHPVAYHLACRVLIDGRWVLVDATWDLPLKRAGFPVNEHWDGQTDTLCAVKPLRSAIRTAFCRTATNEPCRETRERELNPLDGEEDHRDENEHARFNQMKTGIRTREEVECIRRFYREFDAWLETVRHSP